MSQELDECKPLGVGGERGGRAPRASGRAVQRHVGRGLHSLTSWLNLRTFGDTWLTL